MPVYETALVVFEIGNAYTKVGFAGDAHPRFIIPSELRDVATGNTTGLFKYESKEQFFCQMLDFVQNLFFKHVSDSPRERTIVIVESVFCPTDIRETLAKILFGQLEASSILFVPSHLVSLATLAVDTAVVVDIGYKEATILPVYSGVQVLSAFQAQPIAAEAVHEEIRRQLTDIGVKAYLLTEDVVEEIKVRTCFVTPLERAERFRIDDPALRPCPDVDYPIKGGQVITIPGRLRETAFEVLFTLDNERNSLPHLVLKAILQCPLDMRKQLAGNLFLIGGTAMATGMMARLKHELLALLKTDVYRDSLFLEFMFHTAPAKQNFAAWVGGSLYGGTELSQSKSFSREAYIKAGHIPDWVNIDDNRCYGSK